MTADATITAEESMNETVVVRIRRDLRNRAKAAAAIEGITLEDWLNRAIEQALEQEQIPKPRA
jgi:predicted HicB family RNase H-like nuclease